MRKDFLGLLKGWRGWRCQSQKTLLEKWKVGLAGRVSYTIKVLDHVTKGEALS